MNLKLNVKKFLAFFGYKLPSLLFTALKSQISLSIISNFLYNFFFRPILWLTEKLKKALNETINPKKEKCPPHLKRFSEVIFCNIFSLVITHLKKKRKSRILNELLSNSICIQRWTFYKRMIRGTQFREKKGLIYLFFSLKAHFPNECKRKIFHLRNY